MEEFSQGLVKARSSVCHGNTVDTTSSDCSVFISHEIIYQTISFFESVEDNHRYTNSKTSYDLLVLGIGRVLAHFVDRFLMICSHHNKTHCNTSRLANDRIVLS